MRLLHIALVLTAGGLLSLRPAFASIPDDTLREIFIHEQMRNFEDGALIDLTKNKKEEIRVRAYRALGRIQSVELLDALAEGLGDKKESVRMEAAFAVGQRSTERGP